jgi:hypothetical protein
MTANLTIPLQGAENVLALPLAAVFTDQGDRFAYVRQGNKFERMPIRIGVTDYDYAEVRSGLTGGETVSLVTPPDEVGKAQQAFGAAAKGARGAGGKGGDARGPGGKSASGGGPGGAPAVPASGGDGPRRGGGGERRGSVGS